MKQANLKLFPLAWPIFIEIALFMLMGNIDVIMLSRFNEVAVAAVGNANQIFGLVGLIFSVITMSTAVLLGQYIGAKRNDQLNILGSTAMFGNLVFSLMLSLIIIFFSRQILSLINVPNEAIELAVSYMVIVGGFIFVHSLSMTLSSMIKSSGNTRPVMMVALFMNVLNVIGNYIFLFGPFGIPVLGVQGVAISTAVSRFLGFLYYFYYVKKHLNIHISVKYLFPFPKEIVKKMLHVGIPSALEPLSYQMSQLVIFSIINTLGLVVINTRLYVMTLIWFVFLACMAISQASQIMVAQMIGANKEKEVKSIVYRNLRLSYLITVPLSILLAFFGQYLITIFTNDPAIIQLARWIFIVDVFVELGRVTNLVIINSAKGAGDVKFPAYIGIASMWVFAVGFSYILGVGLGWGLIGIWVSFGLDESVRAVIMLIRWQTNGWHGKKLV